VKLPFHIPLAVGLVDPQGHDLPLRLAGEEAAFDRADPKTGEITRVLPLREAVHAFVFEDVEVPAENLIGAEGMGFALAQKYLNHGRIRHGAHSCGAMARCLDMTTAYVKQRKTFGALLSERQGVQWMLADGYTRLHATRLMVHDAAAKLDLGRDARVETFMAKITGVENGFKVIDDCLQLHGGMGLTRETPLERYWRDLRSFRITEGPTEVLKTTMARSIIKNAGL
jgi:acyl-CoA dehydrogenase